MTPARPSHTATTSPSRQQWGLVAASSALMAISSGVWYSASVFFVALIQRFGWDYASTAGIFSLFSVLYGIWGLPTGYLLDRLGPRRVVLVGGVLLFLALAGNAAATALWHLYLTHSILAALGLSLAGYVPVSVLLTRTFQVRRGLALGTASAGVGVGILALVPLTQLVIDRAGWRAAYLVLAGISTSVILGVGILALRNGTLRDARPARPDGSPADPASTLGGPAEWTLVSAIRSREFWLVTATFTLLNSPIQLILTHQVAHLVEVGHPKILVAGIVGLVGLVSIPGKIGWGYLSDRWWVELIYLAGSSCVAVAVIVLLSIGPTSTFWSLYAYAILMGIGYSVSPAMTPVLCGRFFGGRNFGVIFGALNIVYHAGGAAGIWLAGFSHDLTGSYRVSLLVSIASAVSAAGCVWLAAPRRIPPPRYP